MLWVLIDNQLTASYQLPNDDDDGFAFAIFEDSLEEVSGEEKARSPGNLEDRPLVDSIVGRIIKGNLEDPIEYPIEYAAKETCRILCLIRDTGDEDSFDSNCNPLQNKTGEYAIERLRALWRIIASSNKNWINIQNEEVVVRVIKGNSEDPREYAAKETCKILGLIGVTDDEDSFDSSCNPLQAKTDDDSIERLRVLWRIIASSNKSWANNHHEEVVGCRAGKK